MLYEGKGVVKDIEKAKRLLEEADSKDVSEAAYSLAFNYLDDRGVFQFDEINGLAYLMRAIDLGNIDAALYCGDIFAEGRFGTQDLEVAIECYRLAAVQNNLDGMIYLGYHLVSVGKVREGFQWLKKAKAMGDERADGLLKRLREEYGVDDAGI